MKFKPSLASIVLYVLNSLVFYYIATKAYSYSSLQLLSFVYLFVLTIQLIKSDFKKNN